MNYFCGMINHCTDLSLWEKSIESHHPSLKLRRSIRSTDFCLQLYSMMEAPKTLPPLQDELLYIDGYVFFNDENITNESTNNSKKALSEFICKAISNQDYDKINQLAGSFLIFVFNKQKYYIISDNISSRRFYYYKMAAGIAFSNDLRILLCNLEIPFDINENKCVSFCSNLYAVHEIENDTDTFFESIYKIKSGSVLCFENNNLNEISYFDYININAIKYKNDDPYMLFRKTLNRINDSIIKESDNNTVGISLSGGLDSAVVLASLIDIGHRDNTVAYHIAFRDTNLHQCNDSDMVRQLIKDINVKGRILYADKSLRFKNSVIGSDKMSFIDGPALIGNELSYDMVAAMAKNDNVTSLLTGDGGDYLFMGTKFCGDYYMRTHQYKEAVRRSKRLAKSSRIFDQAKSFYDYNIVPFLPIISNIKYKNIFWEDETATSPAYFTEYISNINKELTSKPFYNNKKHIKDWHRRFMFDFMFPKAPYVDVNIDCFDFKLPLEDNLMFRTVISIPPNYHYNIYRGAQGQYSVRKMILRKSFDDILPKYITNQKNKTLYSNTCRNMILNDRDNLRNLICTDSELLCSKIGIIKDREFKQRIKNVLDLSVDVNFTGGDDVNQYFNVIRLEIWLNIIDKGREFLLELSQIGKMSFLNDLDIEEVN